MGAAGCRAGGIPPYTSFIQVSSAQKDSHQSFISRLLLSLHKHQKPVGLRRIHLRVKCFSKSDEKKSLCLLEGFHYFCSAPREESSFLLFFAPQWQWAELALSDCFGSHRGSELQADADKPEERRRQCCPSHLLPAETFPHLNCCE